MNLRRAGQCGVPIADEVHEKLELVLLGLGVKRSRSVSRALSGRGDEHMATTDRHATPSDWKRTCLETSLLGGGSTKGAEAAVHLGAIKRSDGFRVDLSGSRSPR